MSNTNCNKCGHLLPVEGECVCQDAEALARIQAEASIVDLREPPIGSWASVARMMASLGGDDDIDWDAWKDEMKETDGQGY